MKKVEKIHANPENHIDEALFSALLDNAPECIFILSDTGQIRWINRCALDLLGASSNESLIGQSHKTLWPTSERDRAVAGFKKAQSGQPAQFQCKLSGHNGDSMTFEVLYKPLFKQADKIKYIVASAHPVFRN